MSEQAILIEHGIPVPECQTEYQLLPGHALARDGANEKHRQYRQAKDRLTKQFLNDLYAAWNERGVQALEAVAIHAPDKFVQVVANIVAKHEITVEHHGGFTFDAAGLQEISKRTRELLSRAADRSDPAIEPD